MCVKGVNRNETLCLKAASEAANKLLKGQCLDGKKARYMVAGRQKYIRFLTDWLTDWLDFWARKSWVQAGTQGCRGVRPWESAVRVMGMKCTSWWEKTAQPVSLLKPSLLGELWTFTSMVSQSKDNSLAFSLPRVWHSDLPNRSISARNLHQGRKWTEA